MSCRQQRQFEFGDGVMMNGAVGGGHIAVALDADADFEPQPRDRCNTWPLQKSVGELGHTSPLIHEEIPEEGSLSGSNDNFEQTLPSQHAPPQHLSPNLQHSSPSPNSNGAVAISAANNASGPKKNSARRNAWGNLSYADLITQAIVSSPEKRLTLSQIYDWMVQNVPYFRDKGDSNSSAGWKNSIRHNLSLHSRFVRIQNEGAGKSSWWVINPDAKPGKSSRRRTSTMPSGQDAVKASLEKKRRGVKKKIEQQRAALAAALGQAAGSNQNVGDGAENGPEAEFAQVAPYHTLSPVDFRHRSDSNLSNYSSVGSRLSPAFEDLELFDWEAMTSGALPVTCASGAGSQHDLYAQPTSDSGNELATSMSLSMNLASEAPPPYSAANDGGAWRKPQQPRSGVSVSSSPLVHHQASPVKASPSSSVARANGGGYSPVGGVAVKSEPPSYQELYPPPVPGPSSTTAASSNCNSRMNGGNHSVQAHLRNTLLIKKEAAAAMAHPCSGSANIPNASASTYGVMAAPDGEYAYYAPQVHQQQPQQQQQLPHQPQYIQGMVVGGATYATAPQQILPTELSDIQYDNMFKNDIQCDIDQVIRHELNIAGKIDFSISDNFTNI